MDSATSATRVMFPKAVTKSLHSNARCNLPLTRLQPLARFMLSLISASLSFFASMAFSYDVVLERDAGPLCVERGSSAMRRGKFVPGEAPFALLELPGSFIVEGSLQGKGGVVRRVRRA